MKDGAIVFVILAVCSFASAFVSLSVAAEATGQLGLTASISTLIAFLQTVAWLLIGYMWETLMD